MPGPHGNGHWSDTLEPGNMPGATLADHEPVLFGSLIRPKLATAAMARQVAFKLVTVSTEMSEENG